MIFLYNDPHPIHARIAEHLDATFIPANKGNPVERIISAATSNYYEPILIEGGVPLFEATFIKLLRKTNQPIIILAADETQLDIEDHLSYYSSTERAVHKLGHRFLDGGIAVSDQILTELSFLVNGPVELAEPFILQERYEMFKDVEPDLESNRFLSIGEDRPGIGHDLAIQAVEDLDVHLDIIGKGTDHYSGSNYEGHGFISDDELIEFMESASASLLTHRASAFALIGVESMLAGLPVICTNHIGIANKVLNVDSTLVRSTSPFDISMGIMVYQHKRKDELSDAARKIGLQYDEETGLERFEQAYNNIINEIDG